MRHSNLGSVNVASGSLALVNAFARMFAVFAVWAAFGFGLPTEPLPKTLNVISKMLCFVAAIMLFVWRDADTPKAEH